MTRADIYRPLTLKEKELLARLLSVPFVGRDALKEQVNHISVKTIDVEGSIQFNVTSGGLAHVLRRVPIEGEFEDSDGMTIRVLLHVVSGRLSELEIYKDDSSGIIQMPDVDKLRIINLEYEP
jgi:hypothetical protein